MVGGYLADVFKHLSLCGSDDIHHVVRITPFLALAQDFLEESLAVRVGGELEVVAALVGCEGEEDDPFAWILEEGCDAVFAHVGSHGEGVEVHLLEEGAGIHGAGVAYVASFGVSYDEVVGIVVVEVCYGLVEGDPSFHSHALVEGKVGLVGYAVWGCGVYDGLVEGEDGVFFVEEVGWYLLDVCVEADAEECLLLEDLVDELLACHG